MNRYRPGTCVARGIIFLTVILFVLCGCGSNAPPAKATAEKAVTAAEKQSDAKSGEAAKEVDANKKKARDENIIKALEKVSKDTE